MRAVTRLDQKNQKKRQREQNKIKILNPSTAISAACEMLRIYLTHNGDNDNNDDGEHHHLQQLTTAHRGERSDLWANGWSLIPDYDDIDDDDNDEDEDVNDHDDDYADDHGGNDD